MAKSNFKKLTPIKDTEGGNFGGYEEANGGGTPRGGVWGGKDGRVGWGEREKAGELPQGAHREEQPRTNDGKFTYNSVNGKETKYESRGKTVNPLLTGGENGVKIEDVKNEFKNKQGSLYDKYKDKWYQKGSELITKEGRKYSVKISANDIWEIARVSFDINKGAFNYESENFDETKLGRRSKDEKASIQQAKQNKGETFVQSSAPAGGIAQKPGSQPGQRLSTGIVFQLNPSVIARFRRLQQVQAAGMPGAGTILGSGAAANGPATQLAAGQKANFAFSPNIMNNLLNAANSYLAVPVPMQQQQNKPKVSMGGFFKKNK